MTKEELRRKTHKNTKLNKVINLVLSDAWPRRQARSLSNLLQGSKAELLVQEEILLKGMRAVIPRSIHQKILRMLHEEDPGISRMLARDTLYCYGLNDDTERMVKNCEACQEAPKMPTKNILHPWLTPNRIHVACAGPMEGPTSLVLVDAYSKGPEVVQVQTISRITPLENVTRFFQNLDIREL